MAMGDSMIGDTRKQLISHSVPDKSRDNHGLDNHKAFDGDSVRGLYTWSPAPFWYFINLDYQQNLKYSSFKNFLHSKFIELIYQWLLISK